MGLIVFFSGILFAFAFIHATVFAVALAATIPYGLYRHWRYELPWNAKILGELRSPKGFFLPLAFGFSLWYYSICFGYEVGFHYLWHPIMGSWMAAYVFSIGSLYSGYRLVRWSIRMNEEPLELCDMPRIPVPYTGHADQIQPAMPIGTKRTMTCLGCNGTGFLSRFAADEWPEPIPCGKCGGHVIPPKYLALGYYTTPKNVPGSGKIEVGSDSP